jgi:hypothetical protein
VEFLFVDQANEDNGRFEELISEKQDHRSRYVPIQYGYVQSCQLHGRDVLTGVNSAPAKKRSLSAADRSYRSGKLQDFEALGKYKGGFIKDANLTVFFRTISDCNVELSAGTSSRNSIATEGGWT